MEKTKYRLLFLVITSLLIILSLNIYNIILLNKDVNMSSMYEINKFKKLIGDNEILLNQLEEISKDNFIDNKERMEFYKSVKQIKKMSLYELENIKN